MSLFTLYFGSLLIGLIAWIVFYQTRSTEEEESDAIVLGVVLVTVFVAISTFIISLSILSVLCAQ